MLLLTLTPHSPDNDSRRAEERIGELCRCLDELAPGVPAAWNIPTSAIAELPPIERALLADRLERGDRIVPMGLTGASHALLNLDEIRCDLEWSITNPWGTGFRDLFPTDPPAICPWVDFDRDGAERLYEAFDTRIVTIGRSSADGATWFGSAAGLLPVVVGSLLDPPISAGAIRRALRRVAPGRGGRPGGVGTTVVWADPSTGGERTRALVAAVAELCAGRAFRAVVPDLAAGPDSAAGRAVAPGDLPAAHASAHTRLLCGYDAGAVDQQRAARGSRIRTRRVLEAAAGTRFGYESRSSVDDAHADRDDPVSPPYRRDFIASMLGRAVINGEGIAAGFVDGRFCGVATTVEALRLESPAQTLRCEPSCGGGSPWTVTATESVESCFSFETEMSRGVHTEAILGTGTGSIVIRTEYSIVEEYATLIVTRTLGTSGSVQPGVVLDTGFAIGPGTGIAGLYPDGSNYSRRPFDRADSATRKRRGTIESFSGATLTITEDGSIWSVCAIRESGRPLIWTAHATPGASPRLYVGGCHRIEGNRWTRSVSLLFTPGDDPSGVRERALSGRLPPPIVHEIEAGVRSTRIRRTEPREA